MSHPSVLGSTGRESLKNDVLKAMQNDDRMRRDAWLKEKVSSSVLVGSGVTLADVQR